MGIHPIMDKSNKTNQKKSGKGKNRNVRSLKKGNSNQNNPQRQEQPKGGRTTISPPAKIIYPGNPGVQPLASNIDALVLSIDVLWEDSYFFTLLQEAKRQAQINKAECPVDFDVKDPLDRSYIFNVKGYGGKGYEWLIENHEYSLSIGNWIKPISRPSILITIRSETLWLRDPLEAIHFILKFIELQGGTIRNIKITRLDLCLDTLFPTGLWESDICAYKMTRASSTGRFDTHNRLSGISIGKGNICARLYDKPLEIKQKSKKTWLYPIWGINKPPENYKIIRVEFQLRREAIKELGLHDLDSLFEDINEVWAYCTQKWLIFRDQPDKQAHQRKTLPWWEIIQNGFSGISKGFPAIRVQLSTAEREMICQQIIGYLCSYAAQITQTTDYFDCVPIQLGTVMTLFYDSVIDHNINDLEFKEKVESRMAKYQRSEEKMKKAMALRKDLGFKTHLS